MAQTVETPRKIERIPLDGVSEEDWLAMRHPFLGASETPILMGEGYSGQTLWDLWNTKRKPTPPPGEDVPLRMWLGKAVQGIIAEATQRETGWDLTPNRELLVDRDRRISATVDFRLHNTEAGLGVVETKARDYFSFKERYTEFDACPYDLIQLSQQMILEPEATFGAVVVLVGMQKIARYVYQREQLKPTMADIETRAKGFWETVRLGVEPPILDTDIPEYVAQHFDGIIEDPDDAVDLDAIEPDIIKYQKMHAAKGKAEKLCKELKPAILQAMIGNDGKMRRYGWSKGFLVDVKASLIKERTSTTKQHYRTVVKIAARDVQVS